MRCALPLLTAAALVVVVAAACKDHADAARITAQSCERVYRVCPNVSLASTDDSTQCADVFQGRCGAEMRQHIQCVMGKCDDAGFVDRVEVERACPTTIRAYRECDESDGGVRGPDEGQLPPFPIADAASTD